MRSLVIVSAVLGMAIAQVLPRDTPEVEAARNAFIIEYNRLARLAALAPDIHIYRRDPAQDPLTPGSRPINPPTFNDFSFSANLGSNQQFVPGPNIFHGATHTPGHMAGHLAGHGAKPAVQHRARPATPRTARPTHTPRVAPTPAPRAPTPAPRPRTPAPRPRTPAPRTSYPQVSLFKVSEEPIMRWTGPFADDVPAGLKGYVEETASVIAAKAAHFRAHADHWNQVSRNKPTQR